jgi:hypothetical protein
MTSKSVFQNDVEPNIGRELDQHLGRVPGVHEGGGVLHQPGHQLRRELRLAGPAGLEGDQGAGYGRPACKENEL